MSFNKVLDFKIGSVATYFNTYVHSKGSTLNILKIGLFPNQEVELIKSSNIGFKQVGSYSPLNREGYTGV